METFRHKIHVRKNIIKRRRELPVTDRRAAGSVIADSLYLRPEYAAAGTICLYVSMAEEVDTTNILRTSLGTKRVVAPRVGTDGNLVLHLVTAPERLVHGMFGILEPDGESETVSPEAVDTFIVPGVAFDRLGGRIGYGHGYYDRMLEKISVPVIALAFAAQIVPDTYAEPHDVPVDLIITEKEVIEIC